MYPTLFTLGTIAVPTYSVLLDLGLLAGMGLALWLWLRRGQPALSFLDALTWALLGGVVASRLAYAGIHWDYYSTHLVEIARVWIGGMSLHGALAGSLIGLGIYAALARRSFWSLVDVLAPGMALTAICGWLACLAAGSAYGLVGTGFLFTLSPDIYGVEAPRFALQPVSAAQSLLVLLVLLGLLRLKVRAGLVFATFLLLYFGGQALLEFLRGDEAPLLAGWRLPQLVDVVLALVGIGLVVLLRGRPVLVDLPARAPEATAIAPVDTADPSES